MHECQGSLEKNCAHDGGWDKPFQYWLRENVAKRRTRGEPKEWNAKFAMVAWWLWRWRNDEIFNAKQVPVDQKVGWMATLFGEVEIAFNKATEPENRQGKCREEWLKWRKPEEEWY